MDVIKNAGGASFTIYLPQTEQNKINGEFPQVQVDARGLTTYTREALERLAKKTHKMLDREQRKAAGELRALTATEAERHAGFDA